ncbi:3-isopropylmalate dehydratase small subunit [Niveispirillum cyanobacteriorum]|uniref:3-isopropylmalate dehydratase small subunit n=1 Tax=Niveispirillum cyanobacteriorum TaxID=1612173 RepID=A0A2K9NGG4_9PROT|nr:3-isopropylmalate dehydratase small subunit [Niveispirillum cyanobacteriorum]AUN32191.1 3-isopropylmalate dehydratase small subunit [Niveispirillum cyanobacteriorum]GGE75001.1 3-isopropylmalate dehydratase small subunit [Niveispirillum cyanobacteriorum]
MQPFTTLTAIAAPLIEADVDTDIIYPARFLTITEKKGLGRYAFHDRRYDGQGRELADFVLNRDPWRHAGILVAGPNFGCGSSREQAPWAILDMGIRCIIAPSFAEIFRGNCYRNGMLPVTVGEADHAALLSDASAGASLHVDLSARTITRPDGSAIAIAIDDGKRDALLNGWDEVMGILNLYAGTIDRYEQDRRTRLPWLTR